MYWEAFPGERGPPSVTTKPSRRHGADPGTSAAASRFAPPPCRAAPRRAAEAGAAAVPARPAGRGQTSPPPPPQRRRRAMPRRARGRQRGPSAASAARPRGAARGKRGPVGELRAAVPRLRAERSLPRRAGTAPRVPGRCCERTARGGRGAPPPRPGRPCGPPRGPARSSCPRRRLSPAAARPCARPKARDMRDSGRSRARAPPGNAGGRGARCRCGRGSQPAVGQREPLRGPSVGEPCGERESFGLYLSRGAGSPPEQLPSRARLGPSSQLPPALAAAARSCAGPGGSPTAPVPSEAEGCSWGFALSPRRKAEHQAEIQGLLQSSLHPRAAFLCSVVSCQGTVSKALVDREAERN